MIIEVPERGSPVTTIINSIVAQRLLLLLYRLAKRSLDRVVRIGGYRTIAPQPAHHFRQNLTPKLLPMQVHAPRIVHVISLLREGFHQTDILIEPVALFVINPAPSDAAIVVPAIAQKNSDGFLIGCEHTIGINISA